MNKPLFAGVVLIAIGIAAAQTPPDQTRQIERDKEAMRRAARSAPFKIIGSPTPVRVQPIPFSSRR
jgi:hypothetical protein